MYALELRANLAREVIQRIGPGEDQIDDLRGNPQLRATHGLKEGFQICQVAWHDAEPAPFEGVKGAKDRIYCGRIGGFSSSTRTPCSMPATAPQTRRGILAEVQDPLRG
jgi:hypothetical protein